jgi:hypothetical protein
VPDFHHQQAVLVQLRAGSGQDAAHDIQSILPSCQRHLRFGTIPGSSAAIESAFTYGGLETMSLYGPVRPANRSP